MRWLTATLRSSVGQKFLMGVTGLFLCGFLVIHLAGNLLLYVGPEQYNHYAHAVHANAGLLAIAQVLLYAALIVHIYLSFLTSRNNVSARDVAYEAKHTKRVDRVFNIFGWSPDRLMFVTGLVVLGFLVLHLTDFKFGDVFHSDEVGGREPFDRVLILMAHPLRAGLYLLASLVLAVHVSHGLASACQSLGINHPRYNELIRWASVIFAFVVAIGFASFSAWGISPPDSARPATHDESAPAAPDRPADTHSP